LDGGLFEHPDLGPDYSWGSHVDGLTWDNIEDPRSGAQLTALFEVAASSSSRMSILSQVCMSRSQISSGAQGPSDQEPCARRQDLEPGVIDMHYRRAATSALIMALV